MEGIGYCKREGRGWGFKISRVCESLFKEFIFRFFCVGDGKGRVEKLSLVGFVFRDIRIG